MALDAEILIGATLAIFEKIGYEIGKFEYFRKNVQKSSKMKILTRVSKIKKLSFRNNVQKLDRIANLGMVRSS